MKNASEIKSQVISIILLTYLPLKLIKEHRLFFYQLGTKIPFIYFESKQFIASRADSKNTGVQTNLEKPIFNIFNIDPTRNAFKTCAF